MNKYIFFIFIFLPTASLAVVQSETIFFLQADGKNYLLQRSIHSDSKTHRFHVNKNIQLEDIRHISPARFDWDNQSSDEVNSLSFDSGGFTLIYPDKFGSDLSKNKDGSYTYKSWDGTRDKNNRYGYWYSPGNFDEFSYSWILPPNIELLRYRSNRNGTWTKRENAVSFYAERVNNLTFEISYLIKKPKALKGEVRIETKTVIKEVRVPAPAKEKDCPVIKKVVTSSPPTKAVEAVSVEKAKPSPFDKDSDGDKVVDRLDLCPDTQLGANVDRAGCSMDTDKDGVPDGVDQCIATPEETRVNTNGCVSKS